MRNGEKRKRGGGEREREREGQGRRSGLNMEERQCQWCSIHDLK